MTTIRLISGLVAASLVPVPALSEPGFFAGLDLSGGMASGSSKTTDGGAPWAGGSVVDNVKFGNTVGIGGHAGYRFDPAWSAFLSYQHVRGTVGWTADFPQIGVASRYNGHARSNVIMGNIAYDFHLSPATAIRTSAGLGIALNTLTDIQETDLGSGIFLADVADHTRASPAARISAGIRHTFAPNAVLGLDASVTYAGSFETGTTRQGNLGVTPIGAYRINDVWRTSLSASVRFEF